MSECRPVSGNNPFRINNIVNGTNYTVSLLLSSDFGGVERVLLNYMVRVNKAVSVMGINNV